MTTYTTYNTSAAPSMSGYSMPAYEPPCACDHCPTCGRADWRRWRWPWNWPQPIWQVIPSQLPTCYIGDPPGWLGQGAHTTYVSATA